MEKLEKRVVKNWDGSIEEVLVIPKDRHSVFVEYADRTCHWVTRKYLDSITLLKPNLAN